MNIAQSGKVLTMSHALDFSLGKAAIAYNASEGKPWHGFGAAKPEDAKWTLDDWITNAGLDYEVHKSPAIYHVPNPNFDAKAPLSADNSPMQQRSYENRAVLYRTDTLEALSVMSESHYTPAQPRELLEGLFQLVEGNGFEMDVAGALRGGKVVWGLAKRIDGQGDIAGDVIKPYVLLLTSYDGSYARTGRLTSVRVVCQNTVSYSSFVDGNTTAKQRNNGEFDANKLFDQLGEFDNAFDEYMAAMRAMSDVKMTSDTLKRFFAKLYSPKALKNEEQWLKTELDFDREGVSSNQRNNVATLLDIFRDSPGSALPSADGTLFGALNAVTFYQDHAARTKNDLRWESATIGNGNRSKDKALEVAMEMVSI
jgi:phage/plasmid-like protein (TIGR03299 family)